MICSYGVFLFIRKITNLVQAISKSDQLADTILFFLFFPNKNLTASLYKDLKVVKTAGKHLRLESL